MEPGTAKRVGSVGPSTARAATRVVSGASAAKAMAVKNETLAKPGRVLLLSAGAVAGAAAAAGCGAGTVKAASTVPRSRSISGGQVASKAGATPSALAPSNALRQFPTTTPSKRRAPHSSSDSSNPSELGLASPSVHRTPRVRTLALATPVRPPPLDSPTTVRPSRSLAASLPPQVSATPRRPPSLIGRGPPPACATTARKVSTALKSSTSLQRSTQTPPRVLSQPKSLPPSTLRASRPPPLKRPTTASSIPVSAAKNTRTLKKATPSPSIGEDEDEADDERATARSVRSRSTSLAKENVGLGLSAGAKGKAKESSWVSLAESTRPTNDLAPTRTTIRPAPTKEASLRPHPYHRPHLTTVPAPAPVHTSSSGPVPQLHLSKASITAPDDYNPAGDESWETVESRRLSMLSLGQDTPNKLLDVHETSLLLTSPPLLPTLPARSDISYTSPDPAALRRALDQLSPGFATPVRRPAHLRPARSGRDSASLEEMLKLSHAHKNAKTDEDDWLLCDEGVSVSMRNEMAGVTTPWRTSVAGTLRKSQLGPSLALDDEPGAGLEFLRVELEQANARADKAERDAEEQRDELARLHADEEAYLAAALRKDAEVDQARAQLKDALREKLELEGEWDEERSRLIESSRQPEDESRPDHTIEIALVRAAGAAERSVIEYERFLEDAREEREAVRAAVESIRVLALGVGVWGSLVGEFAVTV